LYNHLVGGGTGLGLADNVREAYAFLASNYAEHDDLVPNDSIFLLGFSRGAYTARTLGGFICAMGILKKPAMPHMYEIFEDWERAGDPHYEPRFFDDYFKHHGALKNVKPDGKLAKSKSSHDRDEYIERYFQALLKLGLTQKVDIKAIGVWDTVGALGIPINPRLQRIFPGLPSFIHSYKFFDTRLDSQVKNAFHALALDERRAPFSPAVWEKHVDCTTNLQQCWFPGVHSNIGGSYEDSGMADITLAWMMDHLSGNTMKQPDQFKYRDWIQFDDEYIEKRLNRESDWYDKQRKEPYMGWARGKVYDSNTFPQSLAGQRTRSPGLCYGTFYENGKEDKNRMLNDTNEFIHSSVRARIDMGGRGVEPDWSQVFPHGWDFRPLLTCFWQWLTNRKPGTYQPQREKGGPLYGWRLDDGHNSHRAPNYNIEMSPDGLQEIKWVFEGSVKSKGKGRVMPMPEAKLGPYERALLQKDKKLSEMMEFTNNGWHWFKKNVERPQQHGRTWPFASP